jgi:hypothetical protein
MKRGHRFQVTIIGQGAPVVCVRAANGDEAERVAAECLGSTFSETKARFESKK